MTAPKTVVPDQGGNWCTVLKTQGDDRYQLHCPTRRPSRDMNRKRLLYVHYMSIDENKGPYCDTPLNFASIDLKFCYRI